RGQHGACRRRSRGNHTRPARRSRRGAPAVPPRRDRGERVGIGHTRGARAREFARLRRGTPLGIPPVAVAGAHMPRLAYAPPPPPPARSPAPPPAAARPAHAQPAPADGPPGMCDCAPAPLVAAAAPALPRWSIGLRATATGTVDKDGNDKTDWSGGGIDL